MNQELSTNPFNPVAPVKTFDEIKISLASPERWGSLCNTVHTRQSMYPERGKCSQISRILL